MADIQSGERSDAAGAETPRAEARRRGDAEPFTLSVDAMSGDHGPKIVIDALARALEKDPELRGARILLHGEAERLKALMDEVGLDRAAFEIRHCDSVVAMDQAPREALRNGRNSSMWRAIDAVAEGEAHAAVSAGNTGAIMTMATVRLRPAPGVARPAIAVLWPSTGPAGSNILLDAGADIRADAQNLLDYAVMGVEYARISLGQQTPRVALLNVGVEETKGLASLREAAELLRQAVEDPAFGARFVGFVEGDQIASDAADVIVTDGFTGNIALKSAEGAAKLVGGFVKEAFTSSPWRKLSALLSTPALRSLKKRMDPRRVNGGVFLGLNGVVVKSHGGADAIGFAAALTLAAKVGRRDIVGRIAAQVAKLDRAPKDRATESAAI